MATDEKEKLVQIKKNVKESYEYFKDNNERYQKFTNFVFNTAITEEEISKLMDLQKPSIEFNVTEAFINRLRGEFAKQTPCLNVRGADGLPLDLMTDDFLAQREAVEGIIRHIFFGGKNDSLKYNIYTEQLIGGYSVGRVGTRYTHPRSFEQEIYVEKVFDPTLTGFDPMARTSHKGDGEYCFEIIPMTEDDFNAKFGKDAGQGFLYLRQLGDFNWTYTDANKKIALVVYYWEKIKKATKIIKLTNGHVIVKKHYAQLKELWEMKGRIDQMPQIIEERDTELEYIDRYLVSEKGILEHNSTDYTHLPLVFFDGNSQIIKKQPQAPSKQMTRPYVYNAHGMQKFINFCGQTLAADIEGMVTHKFKVALESIPDKYFDAYTNPQLESVLIYNAFNPKNPEQALPPPQEIVRTPIPPIVQEMFMNGPNVIQNILGSYDAELGIQDNQISGKAIQQGALSSNAAALPYLEGFINGLNRIGQIIIDLIPKYYVTPRTVPIIRPNGVHDHIEINRPKREEESPQELQAGNEQPQQGEQKSKKLASISTMFDPATMQITVEAGVNSAVEKNMALEKATRLMEVFPLFAQFMGEKGLSFALDNLDMRGVEELKSAAVEFMEQLEQQKKQNGEQPPPEQQLIMGQIEVEKEKTAQRAQEAQMKAERDEKELEIKAAGMAADKQLEKEKLNIELIKLMSELDMNDRKQVFEDERISREGTREALQDLIDVAKHVHEERKHADEHELKLKEHAKSNSEVA